MQQTVIGWDVGGAHLKAAVVDWQNQTTQVIQVACPLWKGIDQLHQAVAAIRPRLPQHRCLHAITMTGELVDCFSSRNHGVESIIAAMQTLLSDQDIGFYAGHRGFLSPADISVNDYAFIASANWLASAALAANQVGTALFVDMGSTTTDILLLENQQVAAVGYTDYQRLVSGELLYTGVVRTAVMAVCQQAIFKGQSMGLMAEYFATMADAYRLTGDLNPAHDQSETADGADKSLQASAIRLSRMTGYEFNQAEWPIWEAFAGYLKQQQQQSVRDACQIQLRRYTGQQPLTLIGAGIGRFLLREIAVELQMPYLEFADLLPSSCCAELSSSDCAPAVAVAYLARGFGL